MTIGNLFYSYLFFSQAFGNVTGRYGLTEDQETERSKNYLCVAANDMTWISSVKGVRRWIRFVKKLISLCYMLYYLFYVVLKFNRMGGPASGFDLFMEPRQGLGYSTDSIARRARALLPPYLPSVPVRRTKDLESLSALGLW